MNNLNPLRTGPQFRGDSPGCNPQQQSALFPSQGLGNNPLDLRNFMSREQNSSFGSNERLIQRQIKTIKEQDEKIITQNQMIETQNQMIQQLHAINHVTSNQCAQFSAQLSAEKVANAAKTSDLLNMLKMALDANEVLMQRAAQPGNFPLQTPTPSPAPSAMTNSPLPPFSHLQFGNSPQNSLLSSTPSSPLSPPSTPFPLSFSHNQNFSG